MAHRKGAPNTGGRKRGTPNKVTVADARDVCRDGWIPLSSKHPDRVANKLLHGVMRHHTTTTGRPPPCYASPYHHNVASTARSKKR
jgi:hypothetical protein